MTFPRVTRRSFLSGLGAGTAALIARPLVRECFAAGAPPARLLVIYMPNTSIRASWLPTGGRTPLTGQGDARQFTLKACNETLTPAREQMTLVTGLDLKKIQGCNHGSAIVNLMTGSGSSAKGTTFDQIMVDRSPLLKATQVASLQLGTDTRADAGKNGIQLRVMSYGLKGAPMPPEIEPVKTYTRLFGSLMPAGTRGDQKESLEKALAREKSVLDFIGGDLARLQQRLPAAQRDKLDQHLSGLRELERTLAHDATLGPGMLPGPPEAVQPNVSTNHKKIVDQYMLLIKLALQFDVTRVITFMYATGNSQVSLGDFMPGYAVGPLHRLAHAYKAPALIQATNWYCKLTAAFINDLAAVKEADGSSLLDNTMIPFFSEVGQYHEHNDVPFAFFGGKRFGLTGGRCLSYPRRTPNDAWVGAARALGVELATFGDPALNGGMLPELFG